MGDTLGPDAASLALHAGDALVAISLDGGILDLNPVAEGLLGVSRDQAVGARCHQVLNTSLCAERCPLREVPTAARPVTHFNVALRRGGEQEALPVCIVASPLRDGQGETIGVVESIRDVQHIVRLIAERERTASWLAAIVDTFSDAVIACDTDIRITSFNSAAEQLTGYRRDEVLGRSCKEVFASGFCPLEETLRDESDLPGLDLTVRGKGGAAIPVWLTTQLLRGAAGEVVGAVQFLRDRGAVLRAAPDAGYAPLVGSAPVMQALYAWIDRLANTGTTVLLQGESGTGKELVAELLHARSSRSNRPFIKVNCASMPETLLESELFGHVRGAFTGAVKDRAGRFELAHGGTILLDEIGDLPLALQPKLLRVLQERCVERLGSGHAIPLDVRVIAATNRDLAAMVAQGQFREDLYYRLAVVPLSLPPLREHPEDIPALVDNHLRRLAARLPRSPGPVTKGALRALLEYAWPGNVRELENALEFAAVRSGGNIIGEEDLPPSITRRAEEPTAPAGETERRRIAAALARSATVDEAAKRMRMSRATLFRRMKRYGLTGKLLQSQT